MKVSEMVKLLKKAGWKIKRHGSSHDIWFNPQTGATVSIPRHGAKELPSGTAANIMKDAGL